MSEAVTSLPPETVAEAMTVMGRAFTAIRSATSQNYAMGERLSPERLAAVGMLADALHNMPGWLHSDRPVRYPGFEASVRDELAVAVGAIEFLHGRGPFVPRGPFRAEFVRRIMPVPPAPARDTDAAPIDVHPGEGVARRRASWIGGVAAVCGLGLAVALGRGRRTGA
jgi:hypothetical protein